MWEENSYFPWKVALPKPQDASRIALRDLWLACWYSWCFISCSIPKKRSVAATLALSTTDSVSCWAQSLTGLSNCFHYSQRRQKAIPGPSHLNINTVGTVGWVHGLHWAPVSVCHGSSTSYTVQSLQLPSLFKATSYAPILAGPSEGLSICNNSIQEWTYSLYLFIVNVSQHLLFAQIWQMLSFVLNSLSFRRRTPLLTVYGKQSWRRLGRRPERPDFFKESLTLWIWISAHCICSF